MPRLPARLYGCLLTPYWAAALFGWSHDLPQAIILDNTAGSDLEVVGSWVSAQDVVGGLSEQAEARTERERLSNQHYGIEYLHDRSQGKGKKSVTFRPQLPSAGTYEIALWWTSGPDRASRVPISVGSVTGEVRAFINQRIDGGQWNPVATVRIAKREQAWVTIATEGTEDGRVIADAVRFVRRGDPVSWPCIESRPERVLSVGQGVQLLVDDYLVSEFKGVDRVLGNPVKVKGPRPLLEAEYPWEDAGSFGILGTVIFDDDEQIFKMWYWPRRYYHAYAVSRDGINWTRPQLGLREWQGSTENNLFESSQQTKGFGRHFLVYKDENESDPAHRYKGVGDAMNYSQCRLLYSADGLRWRYYNEGKPVTYRAADFTNHLLWSPLHQAYLLHTRSDYGATGGDEEIRGLRTMINPDPKGDPEGWRTLKSWLLNQPGDLPSRRQLYFLVDQIHAGVHLGLMLVYEHMFDLGEGQSPDYFRRHEGDVLNLYLATSRDGVDWDTHWIYDGKPLIERGHSGSFDKDGVVPMSLVTHGDAHFIYYGGWNERHEITSRHGNQRAIGLARISRDRLAGWGARGAGTLTTKPFVFEGSRLLVNIAAPEGEVRVEIQDEAGRSLPGFGLEDAQPLSRVDGPRIQPRWVGQGDVASHQGRSIRLRFHLNNAHIYTFQVE